MTQLAERFWNLFRGYDARHGRYEVQRQEQTGKLTGRASTVDLAPTFDDYSAHLRGDYGIGIIPLTQENRVYFSAMDIDVYQGLSHSKLAARLAELPVLVTKSKSGGAHVWLFTSHGAPAELVVRVLKIWAGELGYGGCEIFPKQTRRGSRADVGNWINLPYFGDSRKCVMVDANGDAHELGIEQFLDVAEKLGREVTDEWLEQIAPKVRKQRSTKGSKVDYEDGPPCIQRIVDEGGPVEGSRNDFFFNVAVYFARKYGNETTVKEKIQALNYGAPEVFKKSQKSFESLPDAELQKTVKSAINKDYSYTCNRAPLEGFCQREKCLSRRYGVGSGSQDLPVEIGGFNKVLTSPPYYYFNADGVRIELKSGDHLLHQRSFRVAVMDATNKVLPVMQQAKWDELVQGWLDKCVDVEAPPDSDPLTVVLEELTVFIDRFKARDKKHVFNGKVYWDEEEGVAIFRLNDFQKHLRNMRVSVEQRQLTQYLKQNGVLYAEKGTTFAGKAIRPWYAPLDEFAPGRNVESE